MTRNELYRPSQSLRKHGSVQRVFVFAAIVFASIVWLTGEHLVSFGLMIGAALHLSGQCVNGDRRLAPWVTPAWRMAASLIIVISGAGICLYAIEAGMQIMIVLSIAAILGGCIGLEFARGDLRAGINRRAWNDVD